MGLSGAFTVTHPAIIIKKIIKGVAVFMGLEVAFDRAFVNNNGVIAQDRFLFAERACQDWVLLIAEPSVRSTETGH